MVRSNLMPSTQRSNHANSQNSDKHYPRITIAVPYYQNIHQLRLALISLINQTNINWVAVVLDDLGGEDAEELIRSFGDARIQYHRNDTNLGLAENWNKGLAFADTELVTLFHADDQLMPNYIESILALMDRHPDATAGHCSAFVINEAGEKYWSFKDEIKKLVRPRTIGDIITAGESGLNSIFCGSWIFCPTLCYRKSKIREYKFEKSWRFVVDIEFMSQILMNGGFLVGTPTTAYLYRRHESSQTAVLTKSLERFEEEFRFLDHLKPNLVDLNWKKSLRKSRNRILPRAHLICEAVKYLSQKDFSMIRETTLMALRGR